MSIRGLQRFGLLVSAAWLLFSATACGGGDSGPVTIVLISIDTCRADHLGIAGMKLADGSSPTPVIDRLAREGTWYPFATTPVPLTLPSHTTMLSGLYPDRHGVRENDSFKVPKRENRKFSLLAEELKGAGFDTAAFVSAQPLERRFGLDAGFRIYDQPERASAKGGGQTFRERPGEITAAKAADYLRAEGAPNRFLFVHFFDPHIPYERRSDHPGLPAGPRGDYLSEIMAVDAAIGQIVDALPDHGAKAWVIVTADHGEGLGEHSEPTHGFLLYESTLRVPLVIKPPRGFAGRFDANAVPRLVDITPTVLKAARIEKSATAVDGRSLFSLPGDPVQEAAVWSDRAESLYAWYQFRYARLRAFRTGSEKLIEGGGRSELFDTAKDAAETADRLPGAAARAEELRRQLRAALTRADADVAQPVFTTQDVAGPYIGGRTPDAAVEPGEDQNDKLPHVLAKWDVVRDLDLARAHLRKGEAGKAALVLKSHAAEADRNPALLLWTGRALREMALDGTLARDARLTELSEAAARFRRLAEAFKDPRGTEAVLLVLRDRQKITGSPKDLEEMIRVASGEIAARGGTPLTFALRGVAKAGLGDLSAAETDLQEAARRDPEDLRIMQDLQDVRRRMGSR